MAVNPTRARKRDELLLRRVKVAEGMRHGKTQAQMAAELGVSDATINKDIKAVRAQLVEAMGADYRAAVATQQDRYLGILRANYPSAVQGNPAATDMALRALRRLDVITGAEEFAKTDARLAAGGPVSETDGFAGPISLQIEIIRSGNRQLVDDHGDEPDEDYGFGEDADGGD